MWKWWRSSQGYCTACALAVIATFLYMAFAIEPRPSPAVSQSEQNNAIATSKQTSDDGASKNKPSETLWQRTTNDAVAFYTLWLVAATCALALVAAIQAALFLWQLKLMREGIRDAKTAADAATVAAAAATDQARELKRSADATERSLTELERAYVFPSITDIHGPVAVSFRIRLMSLGRTPAIIKEVAVKFNGNAPLIGKPDMDMSGLVVAIQDFDWAINDTEWTDFFHSPCAGEQHFFGFVRYLDIFNKEHLSWFGIYLDAAGKAYRAGGQEYNSWD